jgi:hypothetical protein
MRYGPSFASATPSGPDSPTIGVAKGAARSKESTVRKRSRFVSQGVAVVLVLAGIAFLVVQALPNGGCGGCQNNAAQSNLRTALTGAQTYYEGSGHTFVGLMNPGASSISSIQEIDAGLSYVSRPSTGPRVISTEVGTDGLYLVLTAFVTNGTNDCWGILDIEAGALGIAELPGTYFFVNRGTTTSACNAANIKSVSASSTSGFPHG